MKTLLTIIAATMFATIANGQERIMLTWSDNSDNEEGFQIERSEDRVSYEQIGVTAPNQIEYEDFTASPEILYWYRVRAWNEFGNSVYSNVVSGSINTAIDMGNIPNGPTNFSVVRNGVLFAASGFVMDSDNDVAIYEDRPEFNIENGQISVWIMPVDFTAPMTIFSRDSAGYDDGGHCTISILAGGAVSVRIQNTVETFYLESGEIKLVANQFNSVTFIFGNGGMALQINGQTVDVDSYEGGWTSNSESLVLGASAINSDPDGETTNLTEFFRGEFLKFEILER